MFYYISGIVVGVLILINTFMSLKRKDEKLLTIILSFVASIGLISSGVIGFILPSNLEFISILLLAFFALGFLLYYYFLKKAQKSKATKK